ncbi:MAG: 30S ribosomal protein S16 [Gammaproteobacteria bacterium]|nr:30S ribosomal protein S16 [Gammaproteobacteria bacterium]
MVTIRLARTGAKKRPFYHLTVAEASSKRDGRFIERVGFFNPIATGNADRLKVDLERVEYWLSVGARPSERVLDLVREARKVGTDGVVGARPPAPKKAKPAPAPVVEDAPVAEEVAAEAAAEEAPAVEEAPAAEEGAGDDSSKG